MPRFFSDRGFFLALKQPLWPNPPPPGHIPHRFATLLPLFCHLFPTFFIFPLVFSQVLSYKLYVNWFSRVSAVDNNIQHKPQLNIGNIRGWLTLTTPTLIYKKSLLTNSCRADRYNDRTDRTVQTKAGSFGRFVLILSGVWAKTPYMDDLKALAR